MRRILLPVSLVASSLSAQAWVPLGPDAALGPIAAEQPLPPFVFGPTTLAPMPVREFVANGFVRCPASMPAALGNVQAAAYDPVHHRLVVYASTVPLFGGSAIAAVGAFDGARWSVLTTTNAPMPRLTPALAFDPVRNSILMFGGLVAGFPSGTPLGDTWELSGTAWQQLAVAGPAARSGSRLVRAPGGGLLLFGGMGSAGRLADTWTWNGTAWSLQSPATVPPARSEHALAFDPASGRTVLYGGTAFAVSPASGALADAWQWDGLDWSPLPPPQVAPLELPQLAHDGQRLLLFGRDGGLGAAVAVHARTAAGWQLLHHDAPLADVFQPCYTLDLVRQELVRFGGRDLYGSAHRDDTWVWNLGWQLRTPAVRPPARRGAPMAFDPLRGVAVLFGGANTGGVLGDTWTWDGTVWVQQTPASSPPPRVYGAIAFDPLRGTVVLFGGQGVPGYLTDTWEWNGTTWAPVPTAVQPPGATAVSMAFDVSRLVLALYVATAGQPGQLWELGATGWQLANGAGPSYGPLVYDPGAGNLVAMSPYGPADYVQGAWVLRAMATHSFVVSDPARGGILSVPSTGALVQLATLQPAAAVAYGQGCGPLGEVTVGSNRTPALGESVAVRVRTLAGGTPTFLFYGAFDQNVPLGGGCTSWVGGLIIGLGAVAPAHGHAEFGLAVPVAPSLLGAAVFAQPVTLYPNGLGFGNGVRLTVGW